MEAPDKANANMFTRLALPLNDLDPDYPALAVADTMLGAGGNSRLWKRIREGEGLSYTVRSTIGWSNIDRDSTWEGLAIFAPQNRDKVERAFREEIDRALKDGFTAEELKTAQTSVLSYRRLARAQDASLAAVLAGNLYLGRDLQVSARTDAAIAALTLDQVNAALRKYLTPDRFVAVYAGDFRPPAAP